MKIHGCAAVLGLLVACGGGSTPAPELRLVGRLERGAAEPQTTSPLRLAMAWYPDFGGTGPAAPVRAVVVQEQVSFEGAFPVAFTFEVKGAPPPAALFDLAATGGSGRIGYGVLIAFQDGNGNRTFDPIPPGGAPIDHVMGLSVPDPSRPPPPRAWFVVYLDGHPAPNDYWAAFSLQQGYNLLQTHSNFGVERVPLETSVSIPITGGVALDLYACPDAFATLGYMQQACGIDPYGGGYQAQGAVFARPTGASLVLSVYGGAGTVADAAVAIDGVAVAYDPLGEVYQWSDAGAWSGAHQLTIDVPGHPTETLPFTLPEPFSVLSPAAGVTLRRGSPVSVSWTAAAGNDLYDLYFLADDASGAWLFHALTTETAVTTPAIAYTGNARLTVKSLGSMAVGSQGSFLTPVTQVTVPVTFVP